MKKVTLAIRVAGLAILLLMTAASCRHQTPRPEDKYSEEARRLLPDASMVDSVSYLLGVNFAAMLNYGGGGADGDDFGDIDFQRVKEGIDDFMAADEGRYLAFVHAGFSGEGYEDFSKKFDIDPALAEDLIGRYLEARLNARGKDNSEKAEAFFAENKEKEGVEELTVKYPAPKGDSLSAVMQYRIVSPGTDTPVVPGDSLLLSWEGRLLSGRVFDSADSLRVPSFADSLFIRGFSAGLKKLHVGDVATFYIPAELGFGDGRSPQGRPFFSPYAALVFDVTVHQMPGRSGNDGEEEALDGEAAQEQTENEAEKAE